MTRTLDEIANDPDDRDEVTMRNGHVRYAVCDVDCAQDENVTLPRGVTQITDRNGDAADVFQCECCGRTQAYAPPSAHGGITAREAESIGWRRQPPYGCDTLGHRVEWTCPFCTGRVSAGGSSMGGKAREAALHKRCCKAFKKPGGA